MANLVQIRSVRRAFCQIIYCTLIAVFVFGSAAAKDASPSKIDRAKINDAINRAADFLKQAQANDGSFSAASGPGITAIVGAALLRSGRTPQDPVVAKALKYL